MIAYTIHEPSDIAGTPEARADAVQFVKEGIAWWALFFPFLWLIYHRMWIVLAGYFALVLALQLGFGLAGLEAAAGWAVIALSVVFALEANDLRRWGLSRHGYRLVGAVSGRDLTECELKYFTGWETATPRPTPRASAGKAEKRTPASPPNDDVIGLFPDSGK